MMSTLDLLTAGGDGAAARGPELIRVRSSTVGCCSSRLLKTRGSTLASFGHLNQSGLPWT